MSIGNQFLVLVQQEKRDFDSKNLGFLIQPPAKKCCCRLTHLHEKGNSGPQLNKRKNQFNCVLFYVYVRVLIILIEVRLNTYDMNKLKIWVMN